MLRWHYMQASVEVNKGARRPRSFPAAMPWTSRGALLINLGPVWGQLYLPRGPWLERGTSVRQ
jgi:hypothetical protein